MPRERREHPWIDKREGSDTYYVFWYDPEKRRTDRLSLRTTDARQASKRYAAFLIEGQDIYLGEESGAVPTVRQVCEHYFLKAKSANTSEADLRMVFKVLLPELGDLLVTELTLDRMARYDFARANGLVGKKAVATGTRRTEIAYLQAAINCAIKWGKMDAAHKPRLELPEASPARDRWLTYEELDKLREGTSGRLLWFIELSYYTASRRNAVENLTWFQVDMPNQLIRLNPEGRKQTRKRRPVVPIVSELAAVLRDIPKKNQFVLGSCETVYYDFAGLAKSLELDGVSPHTLRHTRAVHLAQQGVSLYTIAGLLGDTMATVERNYLHHCPEHLRGELEGAKSSSKAGALPGT